MNEYASAGLPALRLSNAPLIVRSLPLCPELRLYLLSDNYSKDPLPSHECDAALARPPYWAFCWASGQALARFILDNPTLVRNRTVLDFGAGSGVAGIAAAKAGAREVVACDLDPSARKAVKANAALNQVAVRTCGVLIRSPEDVGYEVILAGDVCYDTRNTRLLTTLAQHRLVLIADSRLKMLPEDRFLPVGGMCLTTVPDLFEDEEFNHIVIYQSL